MSPHEMDRRYAGSEALAALRLSMWGLDLGALDESIEQARAAGVPHEFMLRERMHLMTLLQANPEAAKYAARWLSAVLQLGEALPLAEAERRRQASHVPGVVKTVYEPLETRTQRHARIAVIVRMDAEGKTAAQIAKAVDRSVRQVRRVLALHRPSGVG